MIHLPPPTAPEHSLSKTRSEGFTRNWCSIPTEPSLSDGVLVGDASDYGNLLRCYKSGEPLNMTPGELLRGRSEANDDKSDTQVCSCNSVGERTIRKSIRDGKLSTIAEVKSCTLAGTGCGGCIPRVTELLRDEMKAAGATVDHRLCEHFAYSRQELFQIIKIKEVRSFADLIANHGAGSGCEICKPAVASILASLWNEHILNPVHATLQDTNDRFLANIQRSGDYSVVPRVPGGEITPEKLIAIGKVAKKYGLYTKITGGQRIDLFGAPAYRLPDIWEELIAAGFESGHAYGKALRTVKSCVGSTWCRFGVQDSVGFAIQVENRYRGVRAPHKVKAAVSGCVRECAEAQSKDFGLIATEKGYNLYVCGNGGARPRHADLLAGDLDEETAIRYIDRFLMYYIHTADRLTRTSVWLEAMEGGINYLRDVIVHDRLGIADELERQMQSLVDSYECEWKAVVNDPEKRKFFRQFANTDDVEPGIEFVTERGQKHPGPWPSEFVSIDRLIGSMPIKDGEKDAWRIVNRVAPCRRCRRIPDRRRPRDQVRGDANRRLPLRIAKRVVRDGEHLPTQTGGSPFAWNHRRSARRAESRVPVTQKDLFASVRRMS